MGKTYQETTSPVREETRKNCAAGLRFGLRGSGAAPRFRFTLLALLLLGLPTRAAEKDDINLTVASSEVWGVTSTGSMEPSFNEHWWLLVKRVPWASLRAGDVILFQSPTKPAPHVICHRIWRISSGGTLIITCGDGNHGVLDEGFVREGDFVGLVVGMVRKDVDNGAQVAQH